jgi:hypothetical protein
MITDTQKPTYLSRAEAADFLTKQRNLPIAPATLMKYASTGEGPKHAKWGHRAIYTIEDLNAWAESRLKAKTSTYQK